LSLSGVSVQAEDNGSICSLPDTQWSALSLGWYAG